MRIQFSKAYPQVKVLHCNLSEKKIQTDAARNYMGFCHRRCHTSNFFHGLFYYTVSMQVKWAQIAE
jgi:hypothetical protein